MAMAPFGLCERDDDGNCLGAEWLSFFGLDVPGSSASVGRYPGKAVR